MFCRHPSDRRSSFANTCSPLPQIPGRPSAPCASPSGVPPTWSSPSPRSQMSCRRAPTSTTSRRPILTAVRSARLRARAVPAGCLPERTSARRQWLHARSVAAGPQACGNSSAASAPGWEARAPENMTKRAGRHQAARGALKTAPSSPRTRAVDGRSAHSAVARRTPHAARRREHLHWREHLHLGGYDIDVVITPGATARAQARRPIAVKAGPRTTTSRPEGRLV